MLDILNNIDYEALYKLTTKRPFIRLVSKMSDNTLDLESLEELMIYCFGKKTAEAVWKKKDDDIVQVADFFTKAVERASSLKRG